MITITPTRLQIYFQRTRTRMLFSKLVWFLCFMGYQPSWVGLFNTKTIQQWYYSTHSWGDKWRPYLSKESKRERNSATGVRTRLPRSQHLSYYAMETLPISKTEYNSILCFYNFVIMTSTICHVLFLKFLQYWYVCKCNPGKMIHYSELY